MSELRDVYKSAIDTIMMVVEEERNKVKTHLLTKHKKDIDAANVRDKKLSQELKMQKLETKILNFNMQKLEIKDNHFHAITTICESEPNNTISKQIIKYMKQHDLIPIVNSMEKTEKSIYT
jgi:hypothetical protein